MSSSHANLLHSLLKKCSALKMLVIGDIMVDQYVWGEAERISPEAPVPVVKVERQEKSLGGMGNVLRNLLPFGVKLFPVMVLGESPNDLFVEKELQRLGIDSPLILKDPRKPVPLKTRLLASAQQMVRIDEESIAPLASPLEEEVIQKISKFIPECRIVLISDYGKGLLTLRVLDGLIQKARMHRLPVLVDPKGQNYEIYRGCTLITPNRREAEGAAGFLFHNEHEILRGAQTLQKITGAEAVLITRGKEGMNLYEKNGNMLNISTQAREVYDVTGAGDTVLAFMGLGIGTGLSFRQSAEIANKAAGIVVGKVGAATVTPEELNNSYLKKQTTKEKIISEEALCEKIKRHKIRGQRIVFTNGCFDLLHPGHVAILESAKAKGDILVVALNSDRSVQEIKGNCRPILHLPDRSRLVAALSCVDYVTSFDEPTPAGLIQKLQPEILVKGADYKESEIVGMESVKSNGGKVETIPLEGGYSTTSIIEKIHSFKGQM